MLLLELNEELRVVLDLVEDVLLAAGVLLAPERRRMLEIDSAVLAVKVRH
jgi:hypothetical protein